MAARECPRGDGGRLLRITGGVSNPRPGKPAGAPVLTGYRCTKGHTLSVVEVEGDSSTDE